jgi:hypothetical protein
VTRFDEELGLLTIASLTVLLGQNRQTVIRLIESDAIPVAYVDRKTGERFFTRAVLAAQQRRIGELHAEGTFAAQLVEALVSPDAQVEQANTAVEPSVDEHPVEVPVVARPMVSVDGLSSLDRALNAAIARRNAAEFRSPTYTATPPARPKRAHT